MTSPLYFEDFSVGRQLKSPRAYVIGKEEAIAFAREFDPQPQHTDEVAAKESFFGELVASGWHTAAASMRLKTETELFAVVGGVAGMGLEDVRWTAPVRPGDALTVTLTILAMRPSTSQPGKGIIRYRAETFNQHGARVMEMVTSVMVLRRV